MDIRSVGLSSFARIAHEGVRQADLELAKTAVDKPVGYLSSKLKKQVEGTTRELAALSSQTVDAFSGHAATNEPSAWNKRREGIGFGAHAHEPAVSDLEAARTVYDITSHALEMAAHKPLAVQIGIYQGTLLAISALNRLTLPTLGEAAQKLLEGKNIRMRTDLAALNASAPAEQKAPAAAAPAAGEAKAPAAGDAKAPAAGDAKAPAPGDAKASAAGDAKAPAGDAKDETEAAAAPKKTLKMTSRTFERGGQALAEAGVAVLARAAQAIGDQTAISVLGNPALSASSRLAAVAAVAPTVVQTTPAS